jgi:hypothetical protein
MRGTGALHKWNVIDEYLSLINHCIVSYLYRVFFTIGIPYKKPEILYIILNETLPSTPRTHKSVAREK